MNLKFHRIESDTIIENDLYRKIMNEIYTDNIDRTLQNIKAVFKNDYVISYHIFDTTEMIQMKSKHRKQDIFKIIYG